MQSDEMLLVSISLLASKSELQNEHCISISLVNFDTKYYTRVHDKVKKVILNPIKQND